MDPEKGFNSFKERDRVMFKDHKFCKDFCKENMNRGPNEYDMPYKDRDRLFFDNSITDSMLEFIKLNKDETFVIIQKTRTGFRLVDLAGNSVSKLWPWFFFKTKLKDSLNKILGEDNEG